LPEVLSAPKGHKVLLENEHVRVLEVRIKPHESSGLHSHPHCVVYQISDATVKMSTSDGKSRVVNGKQGDIVWSEGGVHEVENIGETDDYGIIVELKKYSLIEEY
jgi:quercetin dioxygenase-like cupin family protein